VELVEWHSPDEAATPPRNNYLGAAHFAIRVADLDAAVPILGKLLEAVEITWLGTPGPMAEGQPHTGLRNVFFETPFGQLIELDEYGPMPYERFTAAWLWNADAAPWSNSHPTDAAPPPPEPPRPPPSPDRLRAYPVDHRPGPVEAPPAAIRPAVLTCRHTSPSYRGNSGLCGNSGLS
jgi:hypothetical protein